MNKRTNEGINEQANKRKNEGTNKRTNKQPNKRKNEGTLLLIIAESFNTFLEF
jgi:hypothetical protein